MTPVKNIIFDYGGVILNIDHQLPIQAFYELGLQDFGSLYSHAIQSHLFDHLETGKIYPVEFYQQIREISGLELTNHQIETAWNTIILDMPEHRIRLLEKLKLKYRLFLLSNTNIIHYKVYSKQLLEQYGYHFEDLFEKVYFSFKLGIKKPDPEVFHLLIRENHLIPSETLFIDDSNQNILGAKSIGLKSLLLLDGTDVSNLFDPQSMEFFQ